MKDWTRSKALIYLTAIFLAGLAAGAVGGYAVGKRPAYGQPDPKAMTDHIMGKLTAELKLTGEQVRQIRPLVEATGREIHAVHDEAGDRIKAIVKEGNQRISAFLNPEQRQRLEELQRQWEERFHPHEPSDRKAR